MVLYKYHLKKLQFFNFSSLPKVINIGYVNEKTIKSAIEILVPKKKVFWRSSVLNCFI